MIRFLMLIIFLSLICLSAFMIGKYDTTLSISIFNYVVSVSLLFILTLLVFIISLFTLGMKFITWIIMLPFALISRIVGFRRDHQIHLLLDAYASLIMENKADAAKKLAKVSSAPMEYKEHENFLKALAATESEKDAYILYERVKNKEYHNFAAKKIANTLFEKDLYDQALKFIESAELDKSKDAELIYIVMVLYAELGEWEKFLTQVDALKVKYKNEKEKVSELYTKGAKHYLEAGKEKKALVFLKKSLEYNPASMESIEIFCTLNNSQGLNRQNLPILEAAFSLQPSFELFELYYNSCSMEPQKLYGIFHNLVDTKKHRDVLLSIAAYLKLFDEVEALLSCEI